MVSALRDIHRSIYMKNKQLYKARLLDINGLSDLFDPKAGKESMAFIISADAQWSTYFIVPDLKATDILELDILFDEEFRKTNDIEAGSRFNIDLGMVNKAAGIREIEIVEIFYGEPINHIENKERYL